MGTPVRELVTLWGFEVDMKPLERLDQAIETTKSSLTAIGLAAISSAATIFGFAHFTAEAGDQALKMSQKIGIGVEALQELSFAAKLSNISQEELQIGLTQLARHVVDASRGSAEASRGFDQIGLRLRDSNGKLKTADELLLQVSDKFKKLPDGPKKTALALEIFGRSGANLIPFLNQGSAGIGRLRQEAEELGVVLSKEAAEASSEFTDNMQRLNGAIIGVRNIIGVGLLPVVGAAVVALKNFIVANRDLIATDLGAVVEIVTETFRRMLTILSEALRIVRNLSQVFGGFTNVLRIASFAMSSFLAIKLAFGVGQMVMAIGQLTIAWTTMGNAALLAQAKMLTIPLAITAVVAAIALLIEDFLVFKAGGNSVIGLAIEGIGEFAEIIAKKFREMANAIGEFFEPILHPLDLLISGFQTLMGLLDSLAARTGLNQVLQGLGIFGANPAVAGPLGAVQNGISTIQASPSVSLAAGTSNSSEQNTTINQKGHLTVDVHGLAPDVAQKVAETSMQNAFENILRDTGRDAETAVEH